ncbi:MAG: UDP-2,3-diacylglucosamine diphosphatase [Syntrophorhabdaceae bacterium]|nr:UDP-2,3-diacylglucosamine diphosphatase [Syntrophorhabdaceae bacterium]
MKIVFFSDVHMTRTSVDRAVLTLRFIADYCEDADMVVVLGDLFDFYHGYNGYIYPWYRTMADSFRNLVGRGKSVFFLEGNHEFSLGKYFEDYTGVTCATELSLDIDGKRVFLAHGDGFARLSLGRLLKRPFFYGIMDFLGPDLTWSIATLMRPLLSRKSKGYNEMVRDVFRSHARTKFSEGYDVVILAHSHIPDIVEIGDGPAKKRYLNTGDLVSYASFVSYETSSGFSLRTLGPVENRKGVPG